MEEEWFNMIISASRRTDIPAFYSPWFYERLEEGYVCVRNPYYPSKVSKISLDPSVVDGIVLWTKNPRPMMEGLDLLDRYTYYFQFTLNSYGKDLEPNVPVKSEELIDTFISLSEKIGKEKVVWRYDPIILTDTYTIAYHIKYFEILCKYLSPYTEKVIISFLDYYGDTEKNLEGIAVKKPDSEDIDVLMKAFGQIAHDYGLTIDTCAESIDLEKYGIGHAHCIDRERLERIGGFKLNVGKDTSQRLACGCMQSIDIGAYNTCAHCCRYCYANHSQELLIGQHDSHSPFLIGNYREGDNIADRKMVSLRKEKESTLKFVPLF